MRIKFACPHCDRVVRVPAELAGKQGRCPGCRKGLEVPSESTLQSHRRDVERAESQRRSALGRLDELGRLSDMSGVVDAARPSGSGGGKVSKSGAPVEDDDEDLGDEWETAKVLPPEKNLRHCDKCAKQIEMATLVCPHCGGDTSHKGPPWQIIVAFLCILLMPLPGLVFAQFGLVAARKRNQYKKLAWVAVGLNAVHLVAELIYLLVVGLRS